MGTQLVLVRHAESAPNRSIPESDWPLSERGIRQSEELVGTLDADKFFSSPFLRAIETIRPAAVHLNLGIEILQNVRERRLASVLIKDWETELERSWEDFDRSLPGGESSRECQNRVREALTEVVEQNKGKSLVVCSHGNAISLFLNSINQSFGFEHWKQMKNPHLFRLEYKSENWTLL